MTVKTKRVVGVDSGDYETVLYLDNEEHFETVSHTPADLDSWFDSLADTDVVFATEMSRSVFISWALSRNFEVYCTTPMQSSLMRKTTFVSGKKDDPTDAKIHASFFGTHPDLFRAVDQTSETVESLKVLCNWREQLIEDRVASTNQLRSHLKDVFIGLHHLRLNLSNQWVLRALIATPTAQHFAENRSDELIVKLAKHCNRERTEIESLLSETNHGPSKYDEIVGEKIRYLATRTLENVIQARTCERKMVTLCDALHEEFAGEMGHDSVDPTPIEILRSFPMMGANTLARIIAEYPEILHAPDSKSFCAYAGGSPVTKQSGRTKTVHMRYARNLRLQNAMSHLARNSRRSDARMNALYVRHRSKGKREFAALRAMARPIIQTLCAMLKSKSLYRPMEPNLS